MTMWICHACLCMTHKTENSRDIIAQTYALFFIYI